MMKDGFSVIKKFVFDGNLLNRPDIQSYAKDLWPMVYLLSDGSIWEAYVGETTDLVTRMDAHLRTLAKQKFTEALLITNDRFNKSATLDIESNLIKYISGDGQYRLLNANIGLANHNYYQKQSYWDVFKDIWNKLRAEGIAKHSIEHIDNSDLFKYSPYKSLSRDQKESLIELLQAIIDPAKKNILVEGGAGTGKTVLAIFLFKLLHTKIEEFSFSMFGEEETRILDMVKVVKEKYPNPKMALVVPMSSFRKTVQKVFKNVKGLKSNMVVGPADITHEKFDIIVVDEGHRLRRRVTLGAYYKAFDSASARLGLDKNINTELAWIQQQSAKTILFYDQSQSIKPSDVSKDDFDKLRDQPGTKKLSLISQLRSRGQADYVKHLKDLFNCRLRGEELIFKSDNYELLLFDSIEEMVAQIKLRNEKLGLARVVAGYSWPWLSKNDRTKMDITIQEISLQWNSKSEDWVNSANAINEVGCIHTTQGYDLNYAGVIFGKEISYDEVKGEIIIVKNNYHDRNGKTGIEDERQLKEYIINIYETLMLRAIQGTYVYVCDEKLRNYFAKHMKRFGQNSVVESDLAKSLEKENTHRIPLYDLRAAAGAFSEEQKVEDYTTFELPSRYKSSKDLFACTVVGESMNKVIPNDSVCLFSKYAGGSRNGKIVLVELVNMLDPDSGSHYTVKEYQSTKRTTEDEWTHESITLKPLTNAEGYEAIQLSEDESRSLRVIGLFECVL